MNAYYDKARYKSLLARENTTRWNNTRQAELTFYDHVLIAFLIIYKQLGGIDAAFEKWLREHGIVHQTIVGFRLTFGCAE